MSPLEPVALLGPKEARNPARHLAPLLIQVPDLSASARRPAWLLDGENARTVRTRTGPRPQARRKRRLRKEVRVTGAMLLIFLPTSWVCWSVPWERAAAMIVGRTEKVVVTEAVTAAMIARKADPIHSLRLEPVVSATSAVNSSPVREILGPVALPGYILPVDGSEEAAHAGS
jgi:hypothetical protein